MKMSDSRVHERHPLKPVPWATMPAQPILTQAGNSRGRSAVQREQAPPALRTPRSKQRLHYPLRVLDQMQTLVKHFASGTFKLLTRPRLLDYPDIVTFSFLYEQITQSFLHLTPPSPSVSATGSCRPDSPSPLPPH